MKNRTLFMCGVFLMAAAAWAGLNDPVLLNPSFEADVLAPATKTSAITDWWNRTSYCWASEETNNNYPLTPYGNNWVEFGNRSWVYQQIGTWEPDMAMEVSLLIGSMDTKTFPGLHASLWVGGDAGAASDAGANNPTTLESAVGATQIAISELIKPALTGAATSEESVVLSTGSGQTEGTPLWLLLQSAGAQRMLIDNIGLRQLAVSPLYPADAATLVGVDAVLEWKLTVGYTVTGYDVWFGTDPNENLPNAGLTNIVDKELVTTKDPAPSAFTANEALDYDTTYSWRVNIYEPNAPGPDVLTEGVLWSFTTEPPEPQITGRPVGATVAAGYSAVFTVETSNVETYQWHKVGAGALSDGGKISGAETASLTISDVALADEGDYYCVVSNSISPTIAVSRSAMLMTERLVAHWDFEDTLTDTVGGYVGSYVDPNVLAPDPVPVYVGSDLDGNAFEFVADDKHIRIADSNDFNFYPQGMTVNAWVKVDAPLSSATAVSKQNLAGNIGWMLRAPDEATFQMKQASQQTAAGADSIADGAWHMITGQYDGGVVKVYVDGALADVTNENTNTLDIHTDPLVFGAARAAGQGDMQGLLDEVSIWSYAVSPEAVARLYANMTGESVCKEIPLYDFDKNCVVNFADFVEIARTWQDSNIVNP